MVVHRDFPSKASDLQIIFLIKTTDKIGIAEIDTCGLAKEKSEESIHTLKSGGSFGQVLVRMSKHP